MIRKLIGLVIFGLILGQVAGAQGPAGPAKSFSHTLSIEGVGKLSLNYRSLHWNQGAYESAKKSDQIRERLNGSLWKRVGKLDTDVDLVIGGTNIAKGSYTFGINFDANDNFKLVLISGDKETDIPFKTQSDEPTVNYLTFDIRPVDNDAFVFEGRSGNFRATVDLKVASAAKM